MVFVNHFCTITTYSHLYKVHALADSLSDQGSDFTLHVLVSDGEVSYTFNRCRFWKLSDLKHIPVAQSIISKYTKWPDKLRWSLKPVFMQFLLERLTEQLIYVDNDQFFYSDYRFLFDLLNQHSFLLTPHYYKHSPLVEQNWLEASYKVGLYNAGFIGASRAGLKTLQWWAECCEYRCEKNYFRGLFDDQRYLDLIPVMDETAHVVRHKGCNLAGWNYDWCPRTIEDGVLKIDGKYPVVFIHFNLFTIREIVEQRDVQLVPYYTAYQAALKRHKPDLKQSHLYSPQPLSEKLKYNIWKLLTDAGI